MQITFSGRQTGDVNTKREKEPEVKASHMMKLCNNNWGHFRSYVWGHEFIMPLESTR